MQVLPKMVDTVERDVSRRRLLLTVGVLAAGAVLGVVLLSWAHYGTAIFFEMVAAGLAACF